MRRLCILALSTVVLSGCGLPAPYQTYAPSDIPALPPPPAPLIVYGATTTTPDMEPDATQVEPVPAPPPATAAPATNQVAICYNRLWNKPDTVLNAAVQACGGGVSPQIRYQGFNITACPLLVPTRAVFACSPKAP